MKALVYQGPGNKSLEELPAAQLLESGDAIAKVTTGVRFSGPTIACFMDETIRKP